MTKNILDQGYKRKKKKKKRKKSLDKCDRPSAGYLSSTES